MREEQSPSVVSIDEHNLDKECIRLPGDYLKYSTQSANQKWKVDKLKASLSVIQAEAASRIRRRPEKYGMDKATESGITAAVQMDATYQAAADALIDAQHQLELSQAVVWALEHKKRSLTLLVELHGMGYFSTPKISRQGKEAVEEMTKSNVRRYTQRRDEKE